MGKQPFIPKELDDSGMPLDEFRLVCHIFRRGRCYESVANMARLCRMSERQVHYALRRLEIRGVVDRRIMSGKPAEYRLTSAARAGVYGLEVCTECIPGLQDVQAPSASGADKGSPTKELPLRETPISQEIEESLVSPLPLRGKGQESAGGIASDLTNGSRRVTRGVVHMPLDVSAAEFDRLGRERNGGRTDLPREKPEQSRMTLLAIEEGRRKAYEAKREETWGEFVRREKRQPTPVEMADLDQKARSAVG